MMTSLKLHDMTGRQFCCWMMKAKTFRNPNLIGQKQWNWLLDLKWLKSQVLNVQFATMSMALTMAVGAHCRVDISSIVHAFANW